MATYTPVAYTTAANNTQIDFDVTFTFLRTTDVTVSVIDSSGNVLTAGSDYDAALQALTNGTFKMRVVAAGTLGTTQTPIGASHVVSLKRSTDVSQLATVFQDGATFKAADINALITQLFNKIQEVEQSSGEGIGLTDDLVGFDAENKPLRNLAAPTANNDAVRKVDVDSGIGPAITTVAGIASDVTAVVADQADIGVVSTDLSGSNTIGTVAGSIANVNTVGGAIANVTAVAADQADIGVVAADLSGSDTIGTVAGSIANVNTLAGNDAGGTAHLTNISGLAPQASNIGTLATGTDSGGTAYLTHLANAATNAAAANAALEAFNRTYLGAYSADPTVDGNGDALTDGDLYFNSATNNLKFYDAGNGVWITLNNAVQVNSAATLSAVGDVNFGSLAENHFIVRDGSNPAKWVNKTPAQSRSALGLGTAATTAASDYATAAQGAEADTALQPGDVQNNLTSTFTQAPLAANQGKELKALIDTNANAITGKQANILTSTALAAASLTTVTDAGNTVDVRRADRIAQASSVNVDGGATLYDVTATATLTLSDLVAGDIVTLFSRSGTTTIARGTITSAYIDGDIATNKTIVTVGAGTLATVTMVSDDTAIIAGSDLT
jgi:hypothetical protein